MLFGISACLCYLCVFLNQGLWLCVFLVLSVIGCAWLHCFIRSFARYDFIKDFTFFSLLLHEKHAFPFVGVREWRQNIIEMLSKKEPKYLLPLRKRWRRQRQPKVSVNIQRPRNSNEAQCTLKVTAKKTEHFVPAWHVNVSEYCTLVDVLPTVFL